MERGRVNSPVEPRGSAFSYRASGYNLIYQRACIGHLRPRGISYASLVLLGDISAWRAIIFRCRIENLLVGASAVRGYLVKLQAQYRYYRRGRKPYLAGSVP